MSGTVLQINISMKAKDVTLNGSMNNANVLISWLKEPQDEMSTRIGVTHCSKVGIHACSNTQEKCGPITPACLIIPFRENGGRWLLRIASCKYSDEENNKANNGGQEEYHLRHGNLFG